MKVEEPTGAAYNEQGHTTMPTVSYEDQIIYEQILASREDIKAGRLMDVWDAIEDIKNAHGWSTASYEDQVIYEQILASREDIKAGRVMSFEEAMRLIDEENGWS